MLAFAEQTGVAFATSHSSGMTGDWSYGPGSGAVVQSDRPGSAQSVQKRTGFRAALGV